MIPPTCMPSLPDLLTSPDTSSANSKSLLRVLPIHVSPSSRFSPFSSCLLAAYFLIIDNPAFGLSMPYESLRPNVLCLPSGSTLSSNHLAPLPTCLPARLASDSPKNEPPMLPAISSFWFLVISSGIKLAMLASCSAPLSASSKPRLRSSILFLPRLVMTLVNPPIKSVPPNTRS